MQAFISRIIQEIKYQRQKDWTFQEVGAHWDATTDYDDINERTYSYFRRFVDSFALYPEIEPGETLDICTRTGNGTFYYWQRGKIKKVVCADVSEKMLQLCRERLKETDLEYELKIFTQLPLPFADKQFDNILCFETIEHIAQPSLFLKEISRIIKPGGILVLTMPNILWETIHSLAAVFKFHHSEGPHTFLRKNFVAKELTKNNFKIIARQTTVLIPGGPKKLIKLGEYLEKKLPASILNSLGLRRIFICQKN
ncbi:class I SAM-dependent methyltransferase [Patescibacteria group bacterium]|nr:class I SAM-dependent methyltransferase [Patescibacteria group bacterium]